MKTIFSKDCNSLRSSKAQRIIHQFTFIFICSIFTLAVSSCVTFSEPDPTAPVTQEEPIADEPVLEDVDEPVIVAPIKPLEKKGPLEVSISPEEYYTGRYHYSVEFPTFADYPDLTKQINECVQSRFTEFDTLSAKNYQARLDTMSREERAAFDKSSEAFHSFFVRWDHGELSHDFISIKLEISQYVGGANGMVFIDTFNWYPVQNQLLTIEDIPSYMGIHYTETLWFDYLSNNSRFFLENKINRDNDTVISEMIYQSTEPQAENFEHFTIQRNEITLWFEKYQVAPGSFGTPFITLFLED